MTNPTNDKTKEKIISTLNQGASDKESIIESPSGILDQSTIQEALTSSNISRIIKGIEFLYHRIIKDSSQIQGLMIELSNLLPDCSGADYFLKEGLESLKQGVEILKDSETGEKKKGKKG